MKLKTLVAACALAFAGQAFALPATTTPDVTLFVSGSSALQKMIGQVAKSVMDVTTLDSYFDQDLVNGNGKNYRAYLGRASAAAQLAYPSLKTATPGVGKVILILETAKGGSIQGVNPVALSAPVNSLGLTGCTAAGTDSATGAPLSACTGVVTTRVPNAGVSDVEPADLEALANLPAGTIPLTATQLLSLQQHSVLGQVMGIAVTTNVNTNNLTKAQVASLMGGTVQDFSLVDPTLAAGKTVVVCRRTAGSGTQASINAAFFGNPCMSGAIAPADHTASSQFSGTVPTSGGYIVVEGSSSGAVQGCLTAALNGTGTQSISLTSGSLVVDGTANSVKLAAGNYGIGLLGLDSGVPATAKYESINGTAASVANASTGAYDILVESTFNDRGDMAAGTAIGDLYTLLMANAGDPAILGIGGSGGTPIAGVAALSEAGWVSSSFNAAAPVLRVGNFGNTCAPLQQLQ